MTPSERADLAREIAQLNDMIKRVETMLEVSSSVDTGVESPIHKALVDEMRTLNARVGRLCEGVEQLVDELTPKKKSRAGLAI